MGGLFPSLTTQSPVACCLILPIASELPADHIAGHILLEASEARVRPACDLACKSLFLWRVELVGPGIEHAVVWIPRVTRGLQGERVRERVIVRGQARLARNSPFPEMGSRPCRPRKKRQ